MISISILFYIFVAVAIALMFIPPVYPSNGRRPRNYTYLKAIIARILLQVGVWRKKQQEVQSDSNVDCRVPPTGDFDKYYNDSFVFTGTSHDLFFITRLGFRGDGTIDAWWLIHSPELGTLKLEDEKFDADAASGTEISCGGVHLKAIEAGKRWKVKFDGELINEEKKKVSASFDFEWTATDERFHSGKHMHLGALAKTMAEMPWTNGYFEKLHQNNQVRIEQAGVLAGTMLIDGKQHQLDEVQSIRDHSWGRRDWKVLSRYLWFVITLEKAIIIDGVEYTSLSYATANYGTSFKHTVGLWLAGKSGMRSICEATDHSVLFEEINGSPVEVAPGTIPKQFTVEFRVAPNAESDTSPLLVLQIRRTYEHSWFIQDNSFEVCESLGHVTLKLADENEEENQNIGRGTGIIEFGFSKEGGYGRDFPESE